MARNMYHVSEVVTRGGNMLVRVLLVLAAPLVAFYRCGQSNPVPEQATKRDKDFEQLPVREKTKVTPKPETTRNKVRQLARQELSKDGAYLLPLRLFIGMGWLRAGSEKIPDPGWEDGTELTAFPAP